MAESFDVEIYNHLINENTHVVFWKANVTMLLKFPIGTPKKKFALKSKEEKKGFHIDFGEIKMPIKDI